MSKTGSGNTPREAMEPQIDSTEEIAQLRARLAEYEQGRVVHPQFAGEVPRYKLNLRCYLEDDTLHEEGEEIEYLNTPNLEMVPLNDAARQRMQNYIQELTEGARAVAESKGRPFDIRIINDKGTMIAQSMQDARRDADKVQVVSMPQEKGVVYPMPNLPEAQAQAKRRGRPPKGAAVVSAKMPPPPKTKPGLMPEDILGTNYTRQAARHSGG